VKVQRLSQRRVVQIVCLVIVSAVGIASRVFYVGHPLLDKYLGDAIYAIFFYLLLGIIWDRGRPGTKAGLTLAFVLAIEIFQLTSIPLQFSKSDSLFLRFASIVLGTKFAGWDIAAYLVGIVGIYLLDRLYIRKLT
jgi:hypothetical protein